MTKPKNTVTKSSKGKATAAPSKRASNTKPSSKLVGVTDVGMVAKRVRPSRSKAAVAARAAVAAALPEAVAQLTHTAKSQPSLVAQIAATLTVAEIAAMSRMARLELAKRENETLREWKNAGEPEPRPATPVLDWMAATPKSERGGKSSSAKRESVKLPTFVSADHPETFTCQGPCAETKPTNSFPTVKGPTVRCTRCRKCRDVANHGAVATAA